MKMIQIEYGVFWNASIHKSKKVKKYIERHSSIHLFYLPTYSPEYNPVELFWKWIKPKVCGFAPLGGIQELVKCFCKYVWHYINEFMINPINFNFEAYKDLLQNFMRVCLDTSLSFFSFLFFSSSHLNVFIFSGYKICVPILKLRWIKNENHQSLDQTNIGRSNRTLEKILF